MVRSQIKPESVADLEAAATRMFAALDQEQPQGIRYASCKLSDGVTFVAILEVEDGVENPLPTISAFREFQENLKNWIAEPPAPDPAVVIGSYRLFGATRE
jgi:hypothetical protein